MSDSAEVTVTLTGVALQVWGRDWRPLQTGQASKDVRGGQKELLNK